MRQIIIEIVSDRQLVPCESGRFLSDPMVVKYQMSLDERLTIQAFAFNDESRSRQNATRNALREQKCVLEIGGAPILNYHFLLNSYQRNISLRNIHFSTFNTCVLW